VLEVPRPVHFSHPVKDFYVVGSRLEIQCTNPNRYFTGAPYWTGPDGRRAGQGEDLVVQAQAGDVGTYTCQVDQLPHLPRAPPSRSFKLVLAGKAS